MTMTSNLPGAAFHTCQRSAPGRKESISGTGCGPAKVTDAPAALEGEPEAEERAQDVAVGVDVAETEHACRTASRAPRAVPAEG